MAGDADARLTADWFAAFADEVDDMGRGEDQSAAAQAKISQAGVMVWEADGRPVPAGRYRPVEDRVVLAFSTD